jgi:hypothetical protein
VENQNVHTLHAVIGPISPVTEFAGRWVQAQLVPLPQRFGLVPITAALFDDIQELAMLDEPDPFAGFSHLSAALVQAIVEATRSGPLAYVETDYFGGIGRQSAIAWNKGRLEVGPLTTETAGSDNAYPAPPLSEGAINQALRYLGVWRQNGQDEFDMLGLGRYRSAEAALAKVEKSG